MGFFTTKTDGKQADTNSGGSGAEVAMRATEVGSSPAVRVYEPRDSPYIAKNLHGQVHEYFRDGLLDDIMRPHADRSPVTVFDVGANIGIFALEVQRRTHGEARIFCFEPMPVTRAVLQKNITETIDPATPFREAGSRVRAMPFGLSDSARNVTFQFRPHAPECSSMYDPGLLKSSMPTAKMSRDEEIDFFTDKAYHPDFPLWKEHPMMYCVVKTVWPRFMLRAGVARWWDSFNKTEDVAAELRTLSSVIEEHKVKRIDLLKIDVELAELDVLKGINDEDWPKVNAVVVEVHDIDGRLAAMQSLLSAHGITEHTVVQENEMKGGHIYNLCARRPLSSMTDVSF